MSTAIGFVVSAAAWPFIAIMMGYPVTASHTVIVTSIYTVLSIVRGYVVRRFFARGMHKIAISIARRLIT
jgi:phosphate/sulfate permease